MNCWSTARDLGSEKRLYLFGTSLSALDRSRITTRMLGSVVGEDWSRGLEGEVEAEDGERGPIDLLVKDGCEGP